jgi:hypothetical protein
VGGLTPVIDRGVGLLDIVMLGIILIESPR